MIENFCRELEIEFSGKRACVSWAKAQQLAKKLNQDNRELPGEAIFNNEPVILEKLSADGKQGIRFRIDGRFWQDGKPRAIDGWVPHDKYRSIDLWVPAPETTTLEAINNPTFLARSAINKVFSRPLIIEGVADKSICTLLFAQETFYRHDGRCWVPTPDHEMFQTLWEHVELAFLEYKKKHNCGDSPLTRISTGLVNDAMHSLRVAVKTKKKPGQWLDNRKDDPSHYLVCENGIIDLSKDESRFYPHDINFFATSMLPWSFDPNAPKPARWLQCLDEWWPNNPECHKLLQEFLGYSLTTPWLHVFFVLCGAKRGGKGVIARVLQDIIGPGNYAALTLHRLGDKNALESGINKRLLFFPETNWGQFGPEAREILAAISGRDAVEVTAKYKTALTTDNWGVCVITSNSIPHFQDVSGKLESRMILLRFIESFAEKPDPHLNETLKKELPGIIRWAIDGWKRVQQTAKFTRPDLCQEIVQLVVDDSNPIQEWAAENCTVAPNAKGDKAELYDSYRRWCEVRSLDVPRRQTFCTELLDAFPKLRPGQMRIPNEKVMRIFKGIALKSESPITKEQSHA
ncbi:MAG TPA: phage/plasmid primase, P4 family [Pirellulales bacterium]|nr:phage/plasmid primase, P4 family [Pirellulales bacterium]